MLLDRCNWQYSSISPVAVSKTGAARGWTKALMGSEAVSSLVVSASRAKALRVHDCVQAAMDSGIRTCGGWELHHGGTVVHWVACVDVNGTGGGTPGGAGLGGGSCGGGGQGGGR